MNYAIGQSLLRFIEHVGTIEMSIYNSDYMKLTYLVSNSNTVVYIDDSKNA